MYIYVTKCTWYSATIRKLRSIAELADWDLLFEQSSFTGRRLIMSVGVETHTIWEKARAERLEGRFRKYCPRKLLMKCCGANQIASNAQDIIFLLRYLLQVYGKTASEEDTTWRSKQGDDIRAPGV